MVFKSLSLAPLQIWCSSFQRVIYALQASSTTVAGGFRLLIAFLSVIVCTDWHAEACVAIGLNGNRTVNLILATKQTYRASTRVHVIWDILNICLTLTLALLLPAWSDGAHL